MVWSLGLGYLMQPKAFFHGRTIRACFLAARKCAKAQQLASKTPWGKQPFQPVIRKAKVRRGESPRRATY